MSFLRRWLRRLCRAPFLTRLRREPAAPVYPERGFVIYIVEPRPLTAIEIHASIQYAQAIRDIYRDEVTIHA